MGHHKSVFLKNYVITRIETLATLRQRNLKTHQMFSVHNMPEKFESGVSFTLKTLEIFSSMTTPEKL